VSQNSIVGAPRSVRRDVDRRHQLVERAALTAAFVGWYIGHRLPHHDTDGIKSLVSISIAVIATVSALSLGLLLSTANSTFNTRANDVTRLSADIIRLDRLHASDSDFLAGLIGS